MTKPVPALESLSHWWKVSAGAAMLLGFAVLILITVKAYQNAPPIPARVIDPAGTVIFTSEDVAAGQQVFLKHGLMDNGTIWGHGGYLGPDFSAQYLHDWALDVADHLAHERFNQSYDSLTPEQRAGVDGAVAADLKQNHYDPSAGELTITQADVASFNRQIGKWADYFMVPAGNGGLSVGTVSDPGELRQLTAFFAWTAWASSAERPGHAYSYTNNFPYDPLAGNLPTGGALLYSAISVIFLLAGTAVVLLAFGKFAYLGWHRRALPPPQPADLRTTDSQRATLKFMAVAALLFFGQTLIGGATAHTAPILEVSMASIWRPICPVTCCVPGICSWPFSGSPHLMSPARCSLPARSGATSRRGSARRSIYSLSPFLWSPSAAFWANGLACCSGSARSGSGLAIRAGNSWRLAGSGRSCWPSV